MPFGQRARRNNAIYSATQNLNPLTPAQLTQPTPAQFAAQQRRRSVRTGRGCGRRSI
jgi:hypothetical protein